MPSDFGHFSGDPCTRWLATAKAPDRVMELLEDFTYVDPAAKSWLAPQGRLIDGASIPEALWAIVGSPYTGDYRNASIVHDIACEEADTKAKRKAADRMYFYACRCGGCSKWQAIVQYLGVRIGAWLPLVGLWQPLIVGGKSKSAIFQQDAAAASLIGTFYEIAGEVEPHAETLDIDDIEAIAERHLSRKAKVKTNEHDA